jgi:hypothetical protein
MVRPEDTIRAHRALGSDIGEEDEARITPESSFSSTGSNNSGPSSYEDESPQQSYRGTSDGGSGRTPPRQLTQEETIALTRRAVEMGIQETKRSLAGNEVVSDVVRPKLTIDLGHSHIVQIPEAVVDIIKEEVERYGNFCWSTTLLCRHLQCFRFGRTIVTDSH